MPGKSGFRQVQATVDEVSQNPVFSEVRPSGFQVRLSPMNRTGIAVGSALILIATVPIAYVQFRIRSHNWVPLTAPVRLVEGEDVTTPEFKADLDGSYVVGLDFAPTNSPLEECLVGDRLFKDDCKSLGSGLDLDWSVLRQALAGDAAVVNNEAYRPQSFGGAGVVETVLGSFDAQKGEHYKIRLHIRKIAPELNAAFPKVSVEAHRIYWEKWMIFAQASLLFAIVPGISGLLVLIWATLKKSKMLETA
jgi:hypothetical protein